MSKPSLVALSLKLGVSDTTGCIQDPHAETCQLGSDLGLGNELPRKDGGLRNGLTRLIDCGAVYVC